MTSVAMNLREARIRISAILDANLTKHSCDQRFVSLKAVVVHGQAAFPQVDPELDKKPRQPNTGKTAPAHKMETNGLPSKMSFVGQIGKHVQSVPLWLILVLVLVVVERCRLRCRLLSGLEQVTANVEAGQLSQMQLLLVQRARLEEAQLVAGFLLSRRFP